ncbi:MAG: VWA domain-containing protein [Candidatus Acidiferrales bacterium]
MQKGISAWIKRRAGRCDPRAAAFVVAVFVALVLLSGRSLWSGQQQAQAPQQKQAPAPQPQAAPSGAPAQPPQAQLKITTEVRLVTVYATVRDKHGKIIANLNQSDFALNEDGRPQALTYFAHESNLPLTLGLLVDTSRSQRRVLDQERDASYSFLDHLLRDANDKTADKDKDKAFVIHFDHEVELLQDLTTSREKLRAALEHLDEPEFANTSGGGGGSSGRGHGHGGGGGGTLLYDSIYLASNELMQKQKGRKALILLTDGVDNGSKESLLSAIESAQRSNTAVYSILFADEESYGHGGGYGGGHGGYGGGGMGRGGPGGGGRRSPPENRPDGKKVLARISKETGGELYQVSKKLPIEQIYAEIEEGLRNQYSLGYTPDRASAEATYHLIHLTTNQKDLIVQARDGYYSAP